ncbi:helix-turn-helix domain-containing protein [Demequina gelatinilytica]|uniref:helix-turn-helix domain-containing protein n=1 Tax=Demequina gelatinilytica TaxID=1638980 RepID=UPI000780818D|nr:helix-turn-helix transcriptional regulator [Demequina gelatinilytica]
MEAAELARVIGTRVRAARIERGMSLGALARTAGIGKGSLSEIEHGSRNPNLSTLYALAAALGTPLAALLAQHRGAEVAADGIVASLLDVDEAQDEVVEVYRLELAGGHEHRSGAHGAGVVERLLVLRGAVTAGPVDAPQRAAAGQLITWVSDVDHAYVADVGGASALLTVTTPRA